MKNVFLSDERHAALKTFCTEKKLKMTETIDQLVENLLTGTTTPIIKIEKKDSSQATRKTVGRPQLLANCYPMHIQEDRYRGMDKPAHTDAPVKILNLKWTRKDYFYWSADWQFAERRGARPGFTLGCLVMASWKAADSNAVAAIRFPPLEWFNGKENIVELSGKNNEWYPANEMASRILGLQPRRPCFSNSLTWFLYYEGGFALRYTEEAP